MATLGRTTPHLQTCWDVVREHCLVCGLVEPGKGHNFLAGDGPDFNQLWRKIREDCSGIFDMGDENEGGNLIET
jgi:hypothetical protein